MSEACFTAADILLPAAGVPLDPWACIAVDQFTSQPEYWQRAEHLADGKPSTLHIVLPEAYLGTPQEAERLESIRRTMEEYRKSVLTQKVHGYVYVERTQMDGTVRQGLVGAVDLDAYDYAKGSKPAIRPSESTVVERIPPRLKVRRGATLETPHVMMLADDPGCTLVEPIGAHKSELKKVYEGELMQGGGHIAGWAVEDPAMLAQIDAALAALGDIEVNGKTNTLNSVFGPDPLNLLGVVVLTSLGTWGLPQMVHKFYAIKSENDIKKGAVISTVFALIVAGGSYLLGGFDRLFCTLSADGSDKTVISTLSNGKPDFDAMIPSLLHTALPDILIGLVVVLVLSASMSTLSSLVLTSSSTLTIDLIKPNMKKCSDKKEMLIMRVLIAVFLVISVLLAFNKNASISTLMSYSWGALAGAFLGPFMYGLFSKKVTKPAVWCSFILGIGLTLVHMFLFGFGWNPELSKAAASLPLNLASPINAGAIAMLLSLIVVPLVSACTKVKDTDHVENVFTCYAPAAEKKD